VAGIEQTQFAGEAELMGGEVVTGLTHLEAVAVASEILGRSEEQAEAVAHLADRSDPGQPRLDFEEQLTLELGVRLSIREQKLVIHRLLFVRFPIPGTMEEAVAIHAEVLWISGVCPPPQHVLHI